MQRILIILSVLFYQTEVTAQFPRVDIPGSQVRKINSVIVNQEYELHISLPAGYKQGTKKYPVVYLMDSQWDFPLVKSIYGQQYYDGFIPELIIVGVTWGGINPNPDSLRARDYTPTNENRQPQSGGADRFLSFMKDELFPFIEKNYNADPGNRTLMGCSLGGLITLYALFTHTEMFKGYVAASPAIGWDKEVIYKYEQEYFKIKSSNPAKLYITIGGVERTVPGFEKWAGYLNNRHYKSLSIRSKVLENTGHSGTKSETYSRGLQFVFEKPRLLAGPGFLDKYTGIYEAENGNHIEIKKETGNLILYFSPSNKFLLHSASETEFYSTAEFLNLYFKIVDDKVEGVKLERYGGDEFMKRKKEDQ